MIIVQKVEEGTTGAAAGFEVGDRIHRVNGQPIMDPIDFRVHAADNYVSLEVERDGEYYDVEVTRSPGEAFGLEFGDMKLMRCNNRCVFCFIHQMPPGMRRSLYIEDDDYRHSFLHGSYVTLTNVGESQLERIISQRLSPQYLSVHATDHQLRQRLLGRRKPSPDILEQIRRLADNGIEMHAQIVLCPGWNDGAQLERTISDLAAFYPAMRSVAMVPVGLTRFRDELPDITPVTPENAAVCLDLAARYGATCVRRFGERFVYGSDEMFLLAGRPIPAADYYHAYPQLENGVGMARSFLDSWSGESHLLSRHVARGARVGVVTGQLAASFLAPVVEQIGRLSALTAELIVVPNRYFGHGITVSGLLTGQDILETLAGRSDLDVAFLPPNCINTDGFTLDDWSVSALSAKLQLPLVVGTYHLARSLADFMRNGLPNMSDNLISGR